MSDPMYGSSSSKRLKATSDDSSSTEGPFVYKRSTSLKLVKSDISAHNRKGHSNSLDVKPASNSYTSSTKRTQKQGKNVQVCTVVDAGCTCRATVSSQHKQRRASGSSSASSRDVGSLHDVCRPRSAQALEVKGDNAKSSSSSYGAAPGTNRSMVSRLVCKSSHDVIRHNQLNAEQSHMTRTSSHDEGTQYNACTPQVRDSEASAAQLDVHELECRLRNAGLEERRRSSQKKNKFYYEEGSVTSSGMSSSLGTSANTDTVLTTTTSEVQDMLLNANPAFDMDVLSMGEHLMCLDDLRASIVQRKLATVSPRASLSAGNLGLDGMNDKVALSGSPSSFSSENIRSANGVSPPLKWSPNGDTRQEKLEVSVKHVDVSATKKVAGFESDDIANQGLVKQRHKASSNNTPNKVKEIGRDHEEASRRAARRIDLGLRREADVVQHGSGKNRGSRPSTCSTQGQGHGLNRFNVSLARGGTNAYEANSREANMDVLALEGCIRGCPEDNIGQEKQVVSSSSCEIQVLSDYNHEKQCDAAQNYPMLRIHVGGSSSTSDAASTARMHASEEGAVANELMRSDSAVAMVKSSYDPGHDFKESMLEMVVAKRLRTPRQLQQLLECYLSLNPQEYHPIIIKVFHELCTELFK